MLASIIVNICAINWKYIGNTLDGMANIYFLIRGWGEVLASIIGRAGKRKTGVNGGLSPVWSRWNSSQSPVTSHQSDPNENHHHHHHKNIFTCLSNPLFFSTLDILSPQSIAF